MPSRKSRKLPVFLAEGEDVRLLAAARTPRDRLIILLGLYHGLRVSEIVGLRIERVDFAKRELLVFQGKGGKDRLLPLHTAVIEPLKAWLAGRTMGWVFPSPKDASKHLTTRSVQYLVEKAAKVAGIRRLDGQRVSPHKLRHTFCTRLFERGADPVAIRDLMGHSSLAVTNVYAHTNANRLRSTLEKL